MDNNTKSATASRSSKSSKKKEEGNNTHREAPKARSRGTDAPLPGAHASNTEHKSRTKSGKRSSDDSKSRSRSRRNDEKSAYRSNQRSAASVVPGAQAELSSTRSRSKKDVKGKERRGTRATKPGVIPSTSSRERRKAKSSGSSKKRNTEDRANEDREPEVAATIVEDEDAKKEREQARIREMVVAETQRERRQMEAENQRLREEMERKEAEREEERQNEEKNKKKKRNVIMCVFLALAIGGGVAAFFALQGNNSSDPVVQTTDREEGTFGPSVDPSTLPTVSPSDDPSSDPTNGQLLKYEQPSLEECERIASGFPIDGESKMFDQSFAISMEVDLLEGNDIGPQVPELESKIQKLLVPDLIGCDRDLFNKRRLGHHDQSSVNMNNANVAKSVHHHRQLQSARIRYAIAKVIATVTVTDDACEKSGSPDCSVVTANLDLKVRGEEQVIFLAGVIGEIFPNGVDIRPNLELSTPFEAVVIGTISSSDPTIAPTVAPTGIVSENPSGVPSISPSTSPTSSPDIGTSAPVTGPSDPAPVVAPTKAPSKSPSKTPTPPPTLAPTPTPPPTFAPQPGLTPQPTPPPTKRPTIAPSESPSRNPSSKPSSPPSITPSTKPSGSPSSNPTIQASAAPTPAPTSGPTSAPTFNPTASPTSASPRLGFTPLLREGMTFEQSSSWNSGGWDAEYAVDGDYAYFALDDERISPTADKWRIAHTSIGVGNWWRAKLQDFYGEAVTVNKVTVWNRSWGGADRLEGAVVKLYGAGTDNVIATSAPLTSAIVQTVDFVEVAGVQWVQVQQDSQNTALNIAEMEVWGSIPNDSNNLGYAGLLKEGMYLEQSSSHSSGLFPAEKALDGAYDTYSHTDFGSNQWWGVRLQDYYGQLVTVNKVTVWNTADSCCQDRLEGAVVKLYGATNNLLATSDPLISALVVQTVDFGEVTGVQWVKVHQDSQAEPLQIAEIEAWGKVP